MNEQTSITVKAKCSGLIEPSLYNTPALAGRKPFREGLFSINGGKDFAVDITDLPFPFAVGEELEIKFIKLPPKA